MNIDDDQIAANGLFYCLPWMRAAQIRLAELEQHSKDTRFLLAALIKKAGGRIELSHGEVIAIDANASIVTWDDVPSGRKVWMLQTLTTSSDNCDKT